jgi:hypothetical protein
MLKIDNHLKGAPLIGLLASCGIVAVFALTPCTGCLVGMGDDKRVACSQRLRGCWALTAIFVRAERTAAISALFRYSRPPHALLHFNKVSSIK